MSKFVVVRSEVVEGKRRCVFEQGFDSMSEVETFKSIVNQDFSELDPIHADVDIGTLYFISEEITSPPQNPFYSVN